MNGKLPWARGHFSLLVGLCLIHFILGFDINIVSVSLPAISSYFNVGPAAVTRVVWVYFLVLTCLLIALGRLGDIRGFRKIYTTGIIIFVAGSALASVPVGFNYLLFARVIQALGAAVLFSLTPAVIAQYFPVDVRGKIYGINYSFVAAGGIIGRSASGFIVSALGWQGIFYLTIPVGLCVLYLLHRHLPRHIDVREKSRFDFPGTICISLGLFLFLFVLNMGNQWGWHSPRLIIMALLSWFLITLFVRRQLTADHPLFDLSLLRERNLSFSIVAFFFIYIITNGMIYIMPFYLQWIKLFSKEEAGLLMAVPSVMQLIFGFVSGKLSDERDRRNVCLWAAALIMVGLALHLFLARDSTLVFIIAILAFYGASIGLFIPANTNNVMSLSPSASRGVVSGMMTTFIRLGSASGMVIFGAVFGSFVPSARPIAAGIHPEAIMVGIKWVLFTGLVCALGALLSIFYTKRFRKPLTNNPG